MFDSRRELTKKVSIILTELEIVAMGKNSSVIDVGVSKRTPYGQMSLALFRPKNSKSFC